MCVGFATERFNADDTATGVGADEHSWGVSMHGTHHKGEMTPHGKEQAWRDGDVLGCLIDTSGRSEVQFKRNGRAIQASGAAFVGVKGDVGVCPAFTMDCGFSGYFNLGRHGFRYPPGPGVQAVHTFVLEERARIHRKSAYLPGTPVAIANGRAVNVKRAKTEEKEGSQHGGSSQQPAFSWALTRPREIYFAFPSVQLAGVLLTAGKHYYEVHLNDAMGLLCVGCADAVYGTQAPIQREDCLGHDKHSWGIFLGTWTERSGLAYHRNTMQVFMPEEESRITATLSGLVVGVAIDADNGTMHFAAGSRDDESSEPVIAVAFMGMQYVGGLLPTLASFYCEYTIEYSDMLLLPKLKKAGHLEGYKPLREKLGQLHRAAATGGVSGLPTPSAPPASGGRRFLVPSSGHDHLYFESESGVVCTGSFLCSLTAPELLCKSGASYFEVKLLALGGPGTSTFFDEEAKGYDPTDNESNPDRELPSEGGLAAFGWGSSPRFRGLYHESKGVGHLPLSWGFAGRLLREARTDSGVAGGGDKKKKKKLEPYVEFCAAAPRKEAHEWGTEGPGSCIDDDGTPPIWQVGGVVGCGVVIKDDGSGEVFFFYDGALRYRREVRAPLLAGGLVPAISLHGNMRVAVNFGEEKFTARDAENEQTSQKNPPSAKRTPLQPALRNAAATSAEADSDGAKAAAARASARPRRPLEAKVNDSEQEVRLLQQQRGLKNEVTRLCTDADAYASSLGLESPHSEVGEKLKRLASSATERAQSRNDNSTSVGATAPSASAAPAASAVPAAMLPPAPSASTPSVPALYKGMASQMRMGTPAAPTASAGPAASAAPVAASEPADPHAATTLDLNHKQLCDEEGLIDAIFSVLEAFPANAGITKLICHHCQLRPDTMRSFAPRLEFQESLTHLNLANNLLKASGLTTLALTLRSMADAPLRELNLSDNDVQDAGVAALCCNLSAPSDVTSGKGIRVLRLNNNAIGPEGAASICEALVRLPLVELHLNRNPIGPAGARSLADALSSASSRSATTLACLSVSDAQLGDAGVGHLADGLQHNAALALLRLGSGNQIHGEGLVALANSLSGNKRSRLVALTLNEPNAAPAAQVELLFSLQRAILATPSALDTTATPELQFGTLLHGPRTAASKNARGGFKGGNVWPLCGEDAVRFFKGALTFCVQSLAGGEARLTDLLDELITDRLKRGDRGYVHAADAQAALVEAVLLPTVGTAAAVVDKMVGAVAKGGVRRFTLVEQRARVATLVPDGVHASQASQATPRLTRQATTPRRAGLNPPHQPVGGHMYHALRARPGELWMYAHDAMPQQWRSHDRQRQTGSSSAVGADVTHAGHAESPNEGPHTLHVHVDATEEACAVRDVDVELMQDLWLTAHAIGTPDEKPPTSTAAKAYWLLKPGAREAARGRTALLVAILAGKEPVARLLVARLQLLTCVVLNSATRQPETCPALVVEVRTSTEQRLALRGAAEPRSGCCLVVVQRPDAIAVGARDRNNGSGGTGVEALRMAAVRGMADVVGGLLAYRKQQGHTRCVPGEHGLPCHRLSCLLGMHAGLEDDTERADLDPIKRNLLHDVCRHCLPRGDGVKYAKLHRTLEALAEEVLDLKALRGGRLVQVGRNLIKQKDKHSRTPLHYAAAFGHVALLDLILFVIWDMDEKHQIAWEDAINATDSRGWTPLALATFNGHLDAVRSLEAYGADPMVPLIYPRREAEKRPPRAFAVPCALAVSLLRLQFEEELRPDMITQVIQRRGADDDAAADGAADDSSSPPSKRQGCFGWWRRGTGRSLGDGWRSIVAVVPAIFGEDGEPESAPTNTSLADQLVGEMPLGAQKNAQKLAAQIHDVLLNAQGTGILEGETRGAYTAKRYRRYFIISRVFFDACNTLFYLTLLTIAVLHACGSGAWFGRTTASGVSYPFILQAEVGGLISKEPFDHEEDATFNSVDEKSSHSARTPHCICAPLSLWKRVHCVWWHRWMRWAFSRPSSTPTPLEARLSLGSSSRTTTAPSTRKTRSSVPCGCGSSAYHNARPTPRAHRAG